VGPRVRLSKGIEIGLADGSKVVLDGRGEADVFVLSHAHADHLFSGYHPIVCSPLTAALGRERTTEPAIERVDPPDWIELRPAGHIAGSRSALVTDPQTGRRYCYTGDISTRDRFYLNGFRPPDADVLIIETTYGRPDYRFPPTEQVIADIHGWLTDAQDDVAVLFGYPLGRAQKLQLIAAQANPGRLLVASAIAALNPVIERHRDVTFEATRYERGMVVEPGDVMVLPTQSNRETVLDALNTEVSIRTAGVSGWAVDPAYRYRGDFDATFPLSDHCDFDELVKVVTAVDPERVYTHHGFAEEFATHLTREFGYDARPLKRDQATLDAFRSIS